MMFITLTDKCGIILHLNKYYIRLIKPDKPGAAIYMINNEEHNPIKVKEDHLTICKTIEGIK
jgi:hypothetical protein